MMIVGFAGLARSGKDSAASCLRVGWGFKVMHFADPLKEAARSIFGFDDEQLYGDRKEEIDEYWGISPREALQKLGTEGGRNVFGKDLWMKALMRQIRDDPTQDYAIADVRFPNEAQAIEDLGGHVVHIQRAGVVLATRAHESETALEHWPFKHLIYNDGTFIDLSDKIAALVMKLR